MGDEGAGGLEGADSPDVAAGELVQGPEGGCRGTHTGGWIERRVHMRNDIP